MNKELYINCFVERGRKFTLRTQALDEPPRGGDKSLFGPVQPEFLCWSALVVTAVGLTVWLLRHALHRDSDESPPSPSTPGFCCEKFVIEMSRRANRTVDACNNFLDYACYHRDGLAEANEQLFRAEVLYPTLQGTLRTPASDVLHAYYLSCLFVLVKGLSLTKAAINDVTDMFSRWSGGTDVPVVDTAVILEIKYGISITFCLRLDLKTNKKPFTAELYPTLQYGSSGKMKQDMYRALIDHSISVVNERLGVNVTRKRIADLRLRLNNAGGTADDTETLKGGFELLGQLFPSASLDKWRLHMNDVCSYNCSDTVVVTVKDANVIRTVFDILDSPRFHAQSLAYLVIETTAALFEIELLFDNIPGKGTARWTEFCDADTSRLFELWDLVSAHQFTNQERDDALRSLYDSISGAVIADATDIFASPEDAKEAHTLVSRMRLLLPAQVSNWYQRFLPNLTEDYCTNVIAIRAFRRKKRLHAAAHGIADLSWTREIGLDAFLISLEDAIVVSPILYADIRAEARRETYITAALVGVQLASALWLALFEHRGWSKAVFELLKRHGDCLKGQISPEDPTDLLYPALSLRSTVRAVAGAGWHRALRMWSLWYMSPSQLFYMLFYVRYVCHRHEGLDLLRRSTNFMRRLPDFCAAFRCQPLPRFAKCVHDLRVTFVAV
ncbi:hypothetical protein HPB49_010016 [Dermacentor silvarum]|uniref:Uncharacterized protein n=1 Tax=Dermacentor silvarum TaxID=543639 RepID=A0ACB8CK57_DERSI|nr:hypothetical protein HPB49_010016 [Dermacentor silvarum]